MPGLRASAQRGRHLRELFCQGCFVLCTEDTRFAFFIFGTLEISGEHSLAHPSRHSSAAYTPGRRSPASGPRASTSDMPKSALGRSRRARRKGWP
eukprot:scaffold1704_cov100-Isochrysis_galbana.AAC.5